VGSGVYEQRIGTEGREQKAWDGVYELIDGAEREKEFIILRLRLTRGFTEDEFLSEFGYSFLAKYAAVINRLTSEGLLDTGETPNVRLTPKGMDLANRVFMEFI
jgi:oxygen-independent coproporphyrinogen-3 oxidase